MHDFLSKFLKGLENDPIVRKADYELFRDKHPRETYYFKGGDVVQVTALYEASQDDFLAAFGFDKEGPHGTE